MEDKVTENLISELKGEFEMAKREVNRWAPEFRTEANKSASLVYPKLAALRDAEEQRI